MKKKITRLKKRDWLVPSLFFIISLCLTATVYAQETPSDPLYSRYIMPELFIGKLKEAGSGFPDRGIQKSVFFSLGSYNPINDQEWKYRLNNPRTGLTTGFSEYGNMDQIGWSVSLYPYFEFHPFENDKITFYTSLGLSYHSHKFDLKENLTNKGISTDFAWAYRLSLHYELFQNNKGLFKTGVAYLHHSNGHTKLPNIGYNSFLVTLSYESRFHKIDPEALALAPETYSRSTYNHLEARVGFGVNVLSHIINDPKPVYAFSAGYGKTFNNTFRIGGGFYYRFYQHYYDYISSNGEYIEELYPEFLNNPYGYSTNIGLYGSGEILMNHVGIEFQLGVNIYKPFYQVEWLNNGWWWVHYDEQGEPEIRAIKQDLNWYYEFKRTITSRLGMKYYLIGTDKKPVHNLYVGGYINANLGQADFPEITLGYVYSFNFK